MLKSTSVFAATMLTAVSTLTLPAWSDEDALNKSEKLREAITVKGLMRHQTSLQAIATNYGDRVAGGPGHEASANYVKSTLIAAGYIVKELPFEFPSFSELAPSQFSLIGAAPQDYLEGTDFSTMEYSGSGNVTAPIQNAGGFVLPPTDTPSSASGCDPADFAGFIAGRVALIQRGGCTFNQKATNAAAAGAAAVIIFNEGNPGRTDAFGGTLGAQVSPDLPVLSVSFAVGSALASAPGPTVSISTSTKVEIRKTKNLMAETARGRADRVVVAGAHLDSVEAGAGINDNGSGSSALLEIAVQMSKRRIKPINQVRFMWYSAEESGLLGSTEYVEHLTDADAANIMAMLNFDMIATPNYVRYVYDGDGSDTPDAGPEGSEIIEQIFADYWKAKKLPFAPTAFDGRSDYGPFIDAGIPAGGLFTGADGAKTAEEAAIFGGTAGAEYDTCYHQACDTITNLDLKVFGEMADATAHAIITLGSRKTPLVAPAPAAKSLARSAAVKSSRLYKGPHLQE